MLEIWQKKFPQVFKKHSTILLRLDHTEQGQLDEILTQLTEAELLNEIVVDDLLNKSSRIKELSYLIDKLIQFKYLNQNSLQQLLENTDPSALIASIKKMEDFSQCSIDTLKLLIATSAPYSCAKFIERGLRDKVELSSILHFLSTQVSMRGLSRTLFLFDCSNFSYTKDHFKNFALMTTVLANPLCETIFDARSRCFSDYSEPAEPLKDPKIADSIIQKISQSKDYETRVATFYDFFTEFRPFPESQRYIVDIDIADKVLNAVSNYCLAHIAQVNTGDEYTKTRQLIHRLKTQGGDLTLFDAIKYEVASNIESEDMCSMRTYKQHMTDIWDALKNPMSKLDDFTEALKSSKGYLDMTIRQQKTFIASSSLSSSATASEKEESKENSPMF